MTNAPPTEPLVHSKPQHVGVGVGVFVIRKRDGHILVGKRKGSHGAGTYQLPGGHLEPYESFEDTAKREVLEETSLTISDVTFCTATNDPMPEDAKHYVTIFMKGFCDDDAVPEVCEPEKCEEWHWMTFEDMMQKQPLFRPLRSLAETRKGFHPLK